MRILEIISPVFASLLMSPAWCGRLKAKETVKMKVMTLMMAAAMSLAAMAQEAAPAARGGNMRSVDPVVRMALNPKMAEKLGVTEEQAAKLKALSDDHETIKGLHEKARKGSDRQAELLRAEVVDEAAVMAALDETWAARKEVARLQTKRIIAVRSILSADQIAKAHAAMKEMRNRPKGLKGGSKRRSKQAPKAQPPTEG